MKSQEYWRKREQDNIKRLLKNDINYQKEIERIYAENLRNVEARIDSLYRRYSDKNGEISLADVKAIADKTDVTALAETARKMSQDKDFSQYADDLLAKYNLKMQVSRLELLKDEINLELIKNGVNIDKYVADKLTDEAKAELKRQAGILGNSLDVTDTKLVTNIINGSFGSSTFSERIWGNTQYLANSLDTLLTQSIINGRHPNDVARELRRQFDISQKQSERLMRTESARVHAECAVKSMDKNGVTKYEWVSEPSACKICSPLDGKIFEVKGAEFGNVNHPLFPLHPNCRCAVIAVVDKTADEKSDKTDKTDDNSLDKMYNDSVRELFPREFRHQNLTRDILIKKLKDDFKMDVVETSRTRLSDIALNQVHNILDNFKVLYNALPEKIPKIEAISASKAKDAIAFYSRIVSSSTPVKFGINVKFFKTTDSLQEVVDRSMKSGWFSKNGDINHVMIHEFGHHVDFQLSKMMGGNFSDRVFSNMVNNYGDKYDLRNLSNNIGGYANSYYRKLGKHTESFAELFAEAYGSTPREIAVDFRTEFEKIAKELINNASIT